MICISYGWQGTLRQIIYDTPPLDTLLLLLLFIFLGHPAADRSSICSKHNTIPWMLLALASPCLVHCVLQRMQTMRLKQAAQQDDKGRLQSQDVIKHR